MGAAYEGTVVVGETGSPKSFDLRFEEGPEKGNTSLGIYELTGDTWKICLTTRGDQRPKEFAAPPGTGIALETLQRGAAEVSVAGEAPAATVSRTAGERTAGEIDGEWIPLSVVIDGKPLEKGMLKYGKRTATARRGDGEVRSTGYGAGALFGGPFTDTHDDGLLSWPGAGSNPVSGAWRATG